MGKTFIRWGAILGAIAVMLGALSAHQLRSHLTGADRAIFETGLKYQFYHVFALLVTGILYQRAGNSFLKWSGILFFTGIILFCGSIYTITLLPSDIARQINSITYVTPVGGICFISGWILMFCGMLKKDIKAPSQE